ncbi:pancreatic triacylglycerol lipase-like isoform X1 [Diachasmimorpha longicaudata]|uniref:pancreatic triacylglycerol lipase-like isoform X1 n=1 Tax=Diachasmimorpha longicaudata TaxID=58733 RepID=UPI0030B8A3B0
MDVREMILLWRLVSLMWTVALVYCMPSVLLNNVETVNVNSMKLLEFHLYTRENPFGEEELFLNNTEVLYASHFNESRPTKLIVHGFSDTGNEAWIHDLLNAYLKHRNVNVIIVGWGITAADAYPVAANNTKKIGNYLSDFLVFLNRESNLEFEDVHICSHSLGSHVAGYAGANLKGRIGRITGLDPASPLFETIHGLVHPDSRLDPTDAQFVDIIHTSGSAFGFLAPIGHADFYPNSGKFPQPGCSFPPTMTYCSHSRAHQFMTESIGNVNGFRARHCDNWEKYKAGKCNYNRIAVMGEYAVASLRGKFYLSTRQDSPFALE